FVGADAQSRPNGAAALGRHPRSLARRIDDCVPGRTQQFVFGNQTQSSRLPLHRVSDRHALLCRWQAGDSLLWLIPITNVEEALFLALLWYVTTKLKSLNNPNHRLIPVVF